MNFSPQRVAALIAKESVEIIGDPSTLLIALVLPLILMFLFGYGVSLDTARTRVGVALEGSSADALGLAQSYQRSKWFDVTMARDVAQLAPGLVSGRIRAIIVVPADFGRSRAKDGAAPIEIITDGSTPNTATFVALYAEGVRASWAGDPAPAVALDLRFAFNPELKSRFFLVPGAIANVMAIIGTLLTALVIAREWERGTIEAVFATSVTSAEFLVAKFIPYFALAMASMTLCAILAVTVFGVPFRGSPLALAAIAAAFLVSALGQGLLISALTKNQFVASQIALLTAFLPAMLLSGFLFEISSMPRPVQGLTYFFTARYLIPCLETVFIAGDVWAVFTPNILAMLGFGALFISLAFKATRKRLA